VNGTELLNMVPLPGCLASELYLPSKSYSELRKQTNKLYWCELFLRN